MASIVRKFGSALQWNVAISAATIFIQVGIMTVLARLLSPSDFGVYALANVAVIFARHFGDRGLISAILREPDLDRETIGSAVSLSWVLSALLALTVVVAAPLAAMGVSAADRGSPVVALLRLMSLSILISGIGAPAQALMQRELRFRELGLLQATGITIGAGAVTAILANIGAGPWSLAYGDLANTAIVTAGCWWKARDQWCSSWRIQRLTQLGAVSIQMTVLRILDVLWTQLPIIIASARLSAFDVGLYQRSQSLVDLGVNYTTGRFNSVLVPVLAARQHRKELLKELLPPLIGLYSLFLLPVTAFVAVTASDVVKVLLGAKWEGTARPLSIIMIAFAILHISQPPSAQLEVRAFFAPRIISAGLGAVTLALCSLTFVGRYGLIGIAFAAVVSAAVTATIHFRASASYLGVAPSEMIPWIMPGLGVAGMVAGAAKLGDRFVLHESGLPAWRLVVMGALALVAFIIGFRLLVSAAKRRKLSEYLPSTASRSVVAIYKVFGLRPSAP